MSVYLIVTFQPKLILLPTNGEGRKAEFGPSDDSTCLVSFLTKITSSVGGLGVVSSQGRVRGRRWCEGRIY